MKILLDTHILLWAVSNDVRLPAKARKLIENEENEIYYSLVSLWEVEIMHLAHPDAMTVSAEELAEYCEQSGFQRILVREKYGREVRCRLPPAIPFRSNLTFRT